MGVPKVGYAQRWPGGVCLIVVLGIEAARITGPSAKRRPVSVCPKGGSITKDHRVTRDVDVPACVTRPRTVACAIVVPSSVDVLRTPRSATPQPACAKSKTSRRPSALRRLALPMNSRRSMGRHTDQRRSDAARPIWPARSLKSLVHLGRSEGRHSGFFGAYPYAVR